MKASRPKQGQGVRFGARGKSSKHPRKGSDKTYKATLKHNLFRRERLIRKTVYFHEHRMTTMIDSEANSSYILENVIKKYKIRL